MRLYKYINSFSRLDNDPLRRPGIDYEYDFMYFTVEERIENALPYIFDFTYPLFNFYHEEQSDEDFKHFFETLFLTEFYQMEMNMETVADWQRKLRAVFWKKLPEFNKQFQLIYQGEYRAHRGKSWGWHKGNHRDHTHGRTQQSGRTHATSDYNATAKSESNTHDTNETSTNEERENAATMTGTNDSLRFEPAQGITSSWVDDDYQHANAINRDRSSSNTDDSGTTNTTSESTNTGDASTENKDNSNTIGQTFSQAKGKQIEARFGDDMSRYYDDSEDWRFDPNFFRLFQSPLETFFDSAYDELFITKY